MRSLHADIGDGPVTRQIEFRWCSREVLLPVSELSFEQGALHRPSLPGCKISVLHRQIHQFRFPGRHARSINLLQFAKQDSQRPPIADGMMHNDKQKVVLLPDPAKTGSDQRAVRQVKEPPRLIARELERSHFPVLLRNRGLKVEKTDRDRQPRADYLSQGPVLELKCSS